MRYSKTLANKFFNTFNHRLTKFSNPITGFHIIDFETYVAPDKNDGKSLKQNVEILYGVDAVKIIEDILDLDSEVSKPIRVNEFLEDCEQKYNVMLFYLTNIKETQEVIGDVYYPWAIRDGNIIDHLPTGHGLFNVKNPKKIVKELNNSNFDYDTLEYSQEAYDFAKGLYTNLG